MSKNSPEEVLRRMAAVQRAIGERGWSLQIKRALARELGVHPETIDVYRRKLIAGMKIELDERSRGEKQAEFLERLQGHQRAALASGRLGPLAAMMNIEAKIVGIDSPPAEAEADGIAGLSQDELLDKLAADLTPEMLEAIRERQR
jgi:hypothetical protein